MRCTSSAARSARCSWSAWRAASRSRTTTRRHYDREWLSPANYHVCVNTGWLGVAGAAELVVRMARERLGVVV